MDLLHWLLCKLSVHIWMKQRVPDSQFLQMSQFGVISVAHDHLCNLKWIVFNYKKPISKVIVLVWL